MVMPFNLAMGTPLDVSNTSLAMDFPQGPNLGESRLVHWDCGMNGNRIGEALHPGPSEFLTVGTTNPGGLRSKESLAIEQGCGIWNYAETQLSHVTQPSATKSLKYYAAQEGRHLRVHHGAPAALRSRSSWAGTWTGVTCTSDFQSRILQVEWPTDFWESGRVLATQHYLGHQVVTMITVYGLPRGPTWPKAAQLTNELLAFITKEFVIGYSGIVIVAGDYNFGPHELSSFDAWRNYGFCSAQTLAHERWNQAPAPTCKGATERDMLWLSPMAQSLCTAVEVTEVFHDHASVKVKLDINMLKPSIHTWPRPREIPWHQVDLAAWSLHCQEVQPVPITDPTVTMQRLAASFEHSLDGFVQDLPAASLTSAHCGRASRLQPEKLTPTPRSCRASRPGEVQLVTDTIGKTVMMWFKQLRRFQSYRHSILAGQFHENAVQYRIELWTAIRRAKGFQVSFVHWWQQQDFAQVLGPLPICPPDAQAAIMMYQAFHHAFRQYERWHIHQRQLVLQSKYDKTMKALFQDLRKARPDQVHSFWSTTSFEVVAIREATRSILLNECVPDQLGQWFFQGRPLPVRGNVEELLVFEHMPEIGVGDVLDFHCHTATVADVHRQLQEFWAPKWNAQRPMDATTWQRITHFAAAFMPKIPLTLPPLCESDWKRAVRRFRPTAARGADGWAKLDLLHMDTVHTNNLLSLLTAVENNQVEWPAQLLEGLVIAIAKNVDAHQPNGFRPIVLLSIIYRCWASLRSRQLLRMLEPYIHADAHGFLPTREPAQTWLQIQAAVEVALQSRQPLAGIGTDFVKAFNCIQRAPLWHLAAAIGIPDTLLQPWKSYTEKFTRRFMVSNQVSSPTLSTQGFAEGCPLSVLAMALVDWGYQLYQYHYAPSIRHLSFVDNISMLGRETRDLIWAFFTLRAFLTMWGLSLDLDKTYVWGTTTEIRRQLACLGLRLVSDFSELGGALSFTAAHRVRFFLQRGESLQEKWQQLRRSRAPLHQKLRSLPGVFWARALHGALSTVFADAHLQKLRTQATKHLGLQLAGSNPMLRLSLSQPPTADPGFYQLKTAILDFRRLCHKSPDLVHYWRIYMDRFDGALRDGPFSKMLSLLNGIAWKILTPPMLQDHDGYCFDFLQIAKGALERLLHDGWLQWVATQVNHKTMEGLQGIDIALTVLDHEKLVALDLARVRALQTGAFVSSWQHAKYDKTKQPICSCCLVPDTQKHWLHCPRFAAQRADCGDLLCWIDAAPPCLALHLLAPRSTYVVDLKSYFVQLQDTSCDFHSVPRPGVPNHVFTDGSFFKGVVSNLDRAAWAVVNSTTGKSISYGGVPGLLQTIGRAELYGLISATTWAITHSAHVILWTDSAGTCRKAQAVLAGFFTDDVDGDNHDLWVRLADALSSASAGQVEFRWLPSHVDTSLCDSTLEEYLATWNDIVDHHAVQANRQRGAAFETLCKQAEEHYSLWEKRLHHLRHFYLQVAKAQQDQPDVIDLTFEPTDLIERVTQMPLGDVLTVDWQHQLRQQSDSLSMPVEFIFFVSDVHC